MAYSQGQSVRVYGTYESADGRVTDPSAATLRVRRPNGVIQTYSYMDGTVERISDGTYSALVIASAPGRWLYEFTGTGTVGEAPAKIGFFDVTPSF